MIHLLSAKACFHWFHRGVGALVIGVGLGLWVGIGVLFVSETSIAESSRPSANVDDNEGLQQAVEMTQQKLRSGQARELMGKDPASKSVQTRVKSLSGSDPELEQEVYELAAEVLGSMQGQSPQQMMESLLEAQKNPSGFAKQWTPEQQAKLKELADRMPASRRVKP